MLFSAMAAAIEAGRIDAGNIAEPAFTVAGHQVKSIFQGADSADAIRITYPERLRAADLQPLIDASAKYKVISKSFSAAEMFAPGLSPDGVWTS